MADVKIDLGAKFSTKWSMPKDKRYCQKDFKTLTPGPGIYTQSISDKKK